LPLNLEKLLRGLQDKFGDTIEGLEYCRLPGELHGLADANEDYWERGDGSRSSRTNLPTRTCASVGGCCAIACPRPRRGLLPILSATRRGHALIGRVLDRPEGCAADEEQRGLADVPEEVMFATKPQLAGALLHRAQRLGIDAAFVASDEVNGGVSCAAASASAGWATCWRSAPATVLLPARAAPRPRRRPPA
jgi:hypothetical protein